MVSEFCELTGAAPQEAQQFLEANRWDLSSAAAEYYTSQEEGAAETEAEQGTVVPENYTGPRTLDGRPAPQSAQAPAAVSTSGLSRRGVGGIQTLGSLGQAGGSHAGHGHAHGDDEDDDSDYEPGEQPRDLFAGGEKSGLAVQDPARGNDPRKIVSDLLKKAQKGEQRPGRDGPANTTRFRGTGMTLGGDDTPSRAIPDPQGAVQPPLETATRVLHFWSDGFSVEDGPLHRFDDPANASDLNLIRQGRAPLHLMNVTREQEVEVQLMKHDEPYKAQPKKYTPFGGGGQRLGSPTPGAATTTTTRSAQPSAAAVAPSADAEPEIDPSQPVLNLRIQLANGQRLPARFNTTSTIGDVYGFVERAYPGANDRPWVLATTFPNKEHRDKDAILGEMAEFKKGGTAVQKYSDA